MNFQKYIDEVNISKFEATNITLTDYYDIIEKCISAYTLKEIESLIPKNKGDKIGDLKLQGFARITAGLGILISIGRKKEYTELFYKLMDTCALSFYKERPYTVLDFAVKEFMFAYRVMKDKVPKKRLQLWKKYISLIDPFKCYHNTITNADCKVLANWSVYNMAGEYLREIEGMTDTSDFFKAHMPIQLKKFDENGMYLDPHNPILYDAATRSNLMVITGNGYRGEFYDEIDSNLKKAGLYSLFMQSSSGEFPYGGRSNQYVFNETYVASIYEYEAKRYKKEGNLKLAGMFKRAAHLSVLSIKRWLEANNYPRHIKNFFEKDSKYGTENYGYYQKYMMSVGSFMYIACMFCDDSIEEYPCPSEMGGYILETSDKFHKVFANYNGNSIEIEKKADFIYDSTGLGRFHKKDFPTELALSTPLTANHRYVLSDILKDRNISLCTGSSDGFISEYSDKLHSTVYDKTIKKDSVSFKVKYTGDMFKTCDGIIETYTIINDSINITGKLINSKDNKIYFQIPILNYNGQDYTIQKIEKNKLSTSLDLYNYEVLVDGDIVQDNNLYGNRNGHYNLYIVNKDSDTINIQLKMR